ncbi:MAG: DUF4831 family protein [Deltaproteobacteria bacterium]|nr:MAG: DUF4831 family protein [Deltaproteobacteria bacterium]
MSLIRIICLFLTAVVLAGCSASLVAFRPDAENKDLEERAESIPIFLPRTVLEFKCTAVKRTVGKSKLLDMAKSGSAGFSVEGVKDAARKLGINLNENEEKKEYFIKDPVLTVRGERDPDQLFFVRLDNAPFKKSEFYTQLSNDGVPGSISSVVENKSIEFTVKTIEVAAGIVGKVIGASPLGAKLVAEVSSLGEEKETVLDTIVRQIEAVRTERQALLSGRALSVQVDEKTFARMLDDLSRLELGLTTYFKGAVKEESVPLISTIRPVKSVATDFTLLKYDEAAGFESADDNEYVQQSPLPNEFREAGCCSTEVVLSLKKAFTSDEKALKQIEDSKANERGLPYRIPLKAFAEVILKGSKANQSLIKAEVLLAQWGVVNQLPTNVGWPGSTFRPSYYGESGCLKELSVSGTAISADALSSLDKATNSVTDALKSRSEKQAAVEKERASKADELNQLKHEADMLEQKVRIQGLKEKISAAE